MFIIGYSLSVLCWTFVRSCSSPLNHSGRVVSESHLPASEHYSQVEPPPPSALSCAAPLGYWHPTDGSCGSAGRLISCDGGSGGVSGCGDLIVHQLLSNGCALESTLQFPGTAMIVPVGLSHFVSPVPSEELLNSELRQQPPVDSGCSSLPIVTASSVLALSAKGELSTFELSFRRRMTQPLDSIHTGSSSSGGNVESASSMDQQNPPQQLPTHCDHVYFARLLATVWHSVTTQTPAPTTANPRPAVVPMTSAPSASAEFNFGLAETAPLICLHDRPPINVLSALLTALESHTIDLEQQALQIRARYSSSSSSSSSSPLESAGAAADDIISTLLENFFRVFIRSHSLLVTCDRLVRQVLAQLASVDRLRSQYHFTYDFSGPEGFTGTAAPICGCCSGHCRGYVLRYTRESSGPFTHNICLACAAADGFTDRRLAAAGASSTASLSAILYASSQPQRRVQLLNADICLGSGRWCVQMIRTTSDGNMDTLRFEQAMNRFEMVRGEKWPITTADAIPDRVHSRFVPSRPALQRWLASRGISLDRQRLAPRADRLLEIRAPQYRCAGTGSLCFDGDLPLVHTADDVDRFLFQTRGLCPFLVAISAEELNRFTTAAAAVISTGHMHSPLHLRFDTLACARLPSTTTNRTTTPSSHIFSKSKSNLVDLMAKGDWKVHGARGVIDVPHAAALSLLEQLPPSLGSQCVKPDIYRAALAASMHQLQNEQAAHAFHSLTLRLDSGTQGSRFVRNPIASSCSIHLGFGDIFVEHVLALFKSLAPGLEPEKRSDNNDPSPRTSQNVVEEDSGEEDRLAINRNRDTRSTEEEHDRGGGGGGAAASAAPAGAHSTTMSL